MSSQETTLLHLWEQPHPYYCNEGNYFARESVANTFDTWEGFLAGFGDSDPDYNLVFRWDWQRADPGPEEERPHDRLLIFFMGQRKGLYYYAEVEGIREEDEPSVRAWLEGRLDHLMRLWAPLVPSMIAGKGKEDAK